MKDAIHPDGMSFDSVRIEIASRLRARQSELESEIVARVRNAVEPVGEEDAEYRAGQRAAVASVLDYALVALEQGDEWSGPFPSTAIEQAQRAAQHGVSPETVLCRYVAGRELLGDRVMAEAEHFPDEALRRVQATLGSLLERFMGEIAGAYKAEVERIQRSPDRRRAERIQRLLNGEGVDPTPLDYNFNSWHIAVIATGSDAKDVMSRLKGGLGRQLLLISRGEETVWGWLSGTQKPTVADIERFASDGLAVSVAVGQPAFGLKGFCATHRQAQGALSVARRRPKLVTTYFDVGLEALGLRDEANARELIAVYMAPLCGDTQGVQTLRQTLRAYLDAALNTSAAAHKLKVERRTVPDRLRRVEERLGYQINTKAAELALALRLYDLLENQG